MPLESCMILLDNSEYMRNGDYVPTRLEAQHDAANLLVSQKTQSNPESTVGVIAMSGGSFSSSSDGGVELLVSPTDDMGKILSALHGIPIRGKGDAEGSGVDITASVQVASLALKHRRNKNGQQRVVLFIGSPLGHVESRALVKAGKLLKKNNVAIDVVAMGELQENEGKLKELVDAANGSGGEESEKTCHLVTIPEGVLPSDVLIGSPIVNGGSGGGVSSAAAGGAGSTGGGGGAGGDSFAEFGGVDPNMDPELAMALRVSMEEERARQERVAREQVESQVTDDGEAKGDEEEKVDMEVEESKEKESTNEETVDATPTAVATPSDALSGMIGDEMGDEDALLQQALAMSMAESNPAPETSSKNEEKGTKISSEQETKPSANASDAEMTEEDEDSAMQMALQMSMQTDQEDEEEKKGTQTASAGGLQQFQDPQFVNQLLGSLPGVNPDDPAIRNAIENLNKSSSGGEKNDDEKTDKTDKKDG